MAAKGSRKGGGTFEVLVAAGRTAKDAAAAAGISETTASRRLRDPAVQRRIRELRTQMVQQTAGRLSEAMGEAAEKLRSLLNAENEQVQLSAARSLLEYGLKVKEAVELEERISDLENAVGEAGRLRAVPPDDGDATQPEDPA